MISTFLFFGVIFSSLAFLIFQFIRPIYLFFKKLNTKSSLDKKMEINRSLHFFFALNNDFKVQIFDENDMSISVLSNTFSILFIATNDILAFVSFIIL